MEQQQVPVAPTMEEAQSASTITQVQVIEARQRAMFAMTPTGQMLEEFKAKQRIAQVYASSSLIPASLRGVPDKEFGATPAEKIAAANNKTLANCVIALNMAKRMNADPLMVMQNLYIVHGQPAFSSKFLIACINASKRYTTLQYETFGDPNTNDYGCRVTAYEVTDTKRKTPLVGPTVTIGMAKEEGWFGKTGSKWRTMPEVMLRYRAAAFWQRQFCPEISLGITTAEEAYDMDTQSVQYAEEAPTSSLSNIAAMAMMKPKVASSPSATTNIPPIVADEKEAAPEPEPLGNPIDNEEPSLL